MAAEQGLAGTHPIGPTTSSGHGLAATGGTGLAETLGFAAVFLAAGAAVLAFATRKKGRHC